MAVDTAGFLLTTNDLEGIIVATDPVTADRTDLFGPVVTDTALGIGVDAQGKIIVADGIDPSPLGDGVILSFDPVTGTQEIISGPTVGSGPPLSNTGFLAIVQIPEPSSAILFGLGILLAFAARLNVTQR